MLIKAWRAIAAVVVVGCLAVWGPTPMSAWSLTGAGTKPPVACPPGQVIDPTTQTCVIEVTIPPPPPPGDPNNPPPPGGPDTPPVAVVKCTDQQRENVEVPCTTDAYNLNSYWSNSWNCYVALAPIQPPKTDPIWQGHSDGAIYSCIYPWGLGGLPLAVGLWSATPPPGVIQPPDPLLLARRALATMNLRALDIGIVPEDRPGSIGIIGLPTWMWVQNPSQGTFGPITRSASAGGYTVTATAKVEKVVWKMGDGQTVTCAGVGTAYADSYGNKSSPSCGHTYTRQGRYTVSATSYWTVTWAGVGQTGTIPIDFTTSTNITMGESQVINQ